MSSNNQTILVVSGPATPTVLTVQSLGPGAAGAQGPIGNTGPTGATGPTGKIDSSYVASINGYTGGVTFYATSGITLLTSSTGITISTDVQNKMATIGKTDAFTIAGFVAPDSDDFDIRTNILRLKSSTIKAQQGTRSSSIDFGITFAGATGQPIKTLVTNTHLYIGISAASTGACGVAYFEASHFNVAGDGKVSLLNPSGSGISGDYIQYFNGLTGGVTLIAGLGLTSSVSGKTTTLSTILGMTSNVDGFEIAGGSASRKLSLTGGNVVITGSTAAVTIIFPSISTTLVGVHNTVSSLNGLTGGVTLFGDGGLSITQSSKGITLTAPRLQDLSDVDNSSLDDNTILYWNASSQTHKYILSGQLLNNYVASINGITGSVGISAGSNITIAQSGRTLTINGPAGVVTSIIGGSGITVSNPTGDVTIGILTSGVTFNIQYASASGLSASSNLFFNSSTNMLGITGDITVSGTYYGIIDGGTY